MEKQLQKIMQLIDVDFLNVKSREFFFGKNKETVIYWNRDSSKKMASWSFQVKNSKKYYFNKNNILIALEKFKINPLEFLRELESALLQEAVRMNVNLRKIEDALGFSKVEREMRNLNELSELISKALNQDLIEKTQNKTFSVRISDE